MTDDELVRRCRDGDRAAFNTLFARYQSRVYGLCYHHVGDFAAAHDLAQETFVRVYLDLHKLREVDAFPAWLGKVTSRVCRRAAQRGAHHRHEDIDALPESALADPRAASPAEASVDRERRATVTAAIARLSEPQRLAVTMHYIDGLSYGEIAGFLDVPTTTIRNRLHRARLQLKRGLLTMVEREFERHRLPDEFADEALHEARVVDITWQDAEVDGRPAKMAVLTLSRPDAPGLLLPIWIGAPEAAAIGSAMAGHQPPRPMTHDLLTQVLEAANASVLKVIVSDLREYVFIGTLLIDFDGAVKEIDCRPSDAIAIALREDTPIYVANRLTRREESWVPEDRLKEELGRVVIQGRQSVSGDEEE